LFEIKWVKEDRHIIEIKGKADGQEYILYGKLGG
jgi:hypothetical protein